MTTMKAAYYVADNVHSFLRKHIIKLSVTDVQWAG